MLGDTKDYIKGSLVINGNNHNIPGGVVRKEEDLGLTRYALSQFSVYSSKMEGLEQRIFKLERIIDELQLIVDSDSSYEL